jgi:serine-type D-Ala-D-Ala carboxypeptidase/endopeptidase (penicillin-binding protein 4)
VQSGRTALVLALSVLVLLAAGGYAAYDAGLLERWLGPQTPAAIPPPPGVEPPPVAPPRAVLAGPATGTRPPTPAEFRRHVADHLRDEDYGPHLGVLVQPLGSERDLLRVGGSDLFKPASSMKLLTSTTVLELLGPAHRFSTTVVRGPSPRSVVLVGGGDPLLTERAATADWSYPEPATLRDLAQQTAARLTADGVRRVRLGYDAGLFTGPADNPHWEPDYVSDYVVSPTSALWVDEGDVAPGSYANSRDPAAAAAAEFADQLEAAGITVRGEPSPQRAPARAPALARVRSAPLAQIVQHVLEESDNEAAEVLLRHAAVASGRPGSSAHGAAAVRATLTRLGVDMRRTRIYDGSGLSRDDRLTLDALAQTLQVAASPAQPDLRSVVSGLPVAGFNGSLAYRFVTQGADARGLVRAKTGTLTGVHALAGTTVDRDGTPLVFVAVADRVQLLDTLDARAELDGLTAAIASCCGGR